MKVMFAAPLLLVLSCNNSTDSNCKSVPPYCVTSLDKKTIFKIAQSIIDKHDNPNIWNLHEVDTSIFFSTVDYFSSAKTKNRLVLVGANAGLSAGTASQILILFSCTKAWKVIWAGQTGYFDQSAIRDLDGDGIKEIVCTTGATWMGECHESYQIFNFKFGNRHYLYAASSFSFIDCGRYSLNDIFEPGDTLEDIYSCSPVSLGMGAFAIREIRTVKVHNGGSTSAEVVQKLMITRDTIARLPK